MSILIKTIRATELTNFETISEREMMLRKELEKSYSALDLYDFNARDCGGMVQKLMEKIYAIKECPAAP